MLKPVFEIRKCSGGFLCWGVKRDRFREIDFRKSAHSFLFIADLKGTGRSGPFSENGRIQPLPFVKALRGTDYSGLFLVHGVPDHLSLLGS